MTEFTIIRFVRFPPMVFQKTLFSAESRKMGEPWAYHLRQNSKECRWKRIFKSQPCYHSHDFGHAFCILNGCRHFKMCGANRTVKSLFHFTSLRALCFFLMLLWRSHLWISIKLIRYSLFIFFILCCWNGIASWANSILLCLKSQVWKKGSYLS